MGDEYVMKGKVDSRGWTGHVLNMTSQKWLTDADFSPSSDSKSIWWHYLVVIVPDEVAYQFNASLWITGGSVTSSPPKSTDEDIIVSAALATSTKMVVGALFQIPDEHITFSSDPIQKSRSEDAIIAFTWDHFLKDPSNPEWLVRFPMVKASLRAMDATKEYMQSKYPEKQTSLDYFNVAGASKRGWTTWLVGAVDPKRVVSIVPIVLDAINFTAVEHHQFKSYGAWSFALEDYTDMNITERFDSPNMVTLQQNVDPYFYKDRLTMPKMVVNAGMDEFQQPDDTYYWWSEMPEPKHFLLIPNAEHSLATGILAAVPSISAFIQALTLKTDIPDFTWEIDENSGEIVATVGRKGLVHEASVWWAYSCGVNHWDNDIKRRDFRVAHLDNPCECGPYASGLCINLDTLWQKKVLQESGTSATGLKQYRALVEPPSDGRWVAFLIDFKFHNPNSRDHSDTLDVVSLSKKIERHADKERPLQEKIRTTVLQTLKEKKGKKGEDGDFEWPGFDKDLRRFFEFTTEISILPKTFPYKDCSGLDCGVRLV
jgi:PhoPQ-activated pathogenicity-related protein